MSNARSIQPGKQHGFTLVELMVAIAIAAIVIAFAVPSFEQIRNGTRLSSGANDLLTALQLARSEAIRRNHAVTFCPTNAAQSACLNSPAVFDEGFYWMVIDRNVTPAEVIRTDLIRQPVVVLTSPSLAARNDRVIFRADGLAYNSSGALLNGAIATCLPTARPHENMASVHVAPGGRMAIEKHVKGAVCTGGVNDNGD